MKKLLVMKKKRFDTSNYGIDKLWKDKLGEQIMTEFVRLKPKHCTKNEVFH